MVDKTLPDFWKSFFYIFRDCLLLWSVYLPLFRSVHVVILSMWAQRTRRKISQPVHVRERNRNSNKAAGTVTGDRHSVNVFFENYDRSASSISAVLPWSGCTACFGWLVRVAFAFGKCHTVAPLPSLPQQSHSRRSCILTLWINIPNTLFWVYRIMNCELWIMNLKRRQLPVSFWF